MQGVIREYEAMMILHPSSDEAAVEKVQSQFAEGVSRHGGRVLEVQNHGRQKLSYPIRKSQEGMLFQVRFQMAPAQLPGLEKAARLSESILRLMVVHGTKAAASPSPASS